MVAFWVRKQNKQNKRTDQTMKTDDSIALALEHLAKLTAQVATIQATHMRSTNHAAHPVNHNE